MKRVRQLVARESSAEGYKKVGDEYAVRPDRAHFLEGRGFVEIVGDVTVTELRDEQEAAAEEHATKPSKAKTVSPTPRKKKKG